MPSAARSTLAPARLRLARQLAEQEGEVAQRARIVLAEHRRRTGTSPDAPAGPVVSRQTAAKWFARFAESGAEGLHDLPRAGRPSTHGDDAIRSILVAPLLVPTLRWTSHTVAQLTGLSQTAVVRAWRLVYETRAVQPDAPLPSGLAVVGARVDTSNSVVVLAAQAMPVPPERTTSFMRAPRRPPLQALLAADLVAAGPGGTARPTDESDTAVVELVETLRRRLGAGTALYVLSRRPVTAPAAARVTYVRLAPDQQWQGLLEVLVRRCTATPQPALLALQQRLMTWAQGKGTQGKGTQGNGTQGAEARGEGSQGGPEAFEWLDDDLTRPGRSRSSGGTEPRALGQVVADAVLASILERIAAGRLAAGDRVTESSLSRAAHASRSHVREALVLLASTGLVELEPHRGALVPAPQTADVLETYAVRRALGALVVRRAAQSSPSTLAPARRCLAELVSIGATGDARAAGEADIRFQDALATSIGMRRIPPMFVALSSQIRLFTAVMGVRYAYSIPQMIEDDTVLLEHIEAHDERAASRAWHAKMDDALSYMLTQLGSPGGGPRR